MRLRLVRNVVTVFLGLCLLGSSTARLSAEGCINFYPTGTFIWFNCEWTCEEAGFGCQFWCDDFELPLEDQRYFLCSEDPGSEPPTNDGYCSCRDLN